MLTDNRVKRTVSANGTAHASIGAHEYRAPRFNRSKNVHNEMLLRGSGLKEPSVIGVISDQDGPITRQSRCLFREEVLGTYRRTYRDPVNMSGVNADPRSKSPKALSIPKKGWRYFLSGTYSPKGTKCVFRCFPTIP